MMLYVTGLCAVSASHSRSSILVTKSCCCCYRDTMRDRVSGRERERERECDQQQQRPVSRAARTHLVICPAVPHTGRLSQSVSRPSPSVRFSHCLSSESIATGLLRLTTVCDELRPAVIVSAWAHVYCILPVRLSCLSVVIDAWILSTGMDSRPASCRHVFDSKKLMTTHGCNCCYVSPSSFLSICRPLRMKTVQ